MGAKSEQLQDYARAIDQNAKGNLDRDNSRLTVLGKSLTLDEIRSELRSNSSWAQQLVRGLEQVAQSRGITIEEFINHAKRHKNQTPNPAQVDSPEG